MNVAIMSDVHANLPAFQAVLDALSVREIDMCIHAGDLVGYNPYPSKVIEIFRAENIVSVQGNHDAAVGTESSEENSELIKRSTKWTQDRLNDRERKYLRELPKERSINLEDIDLRLVHDSAENKSEYVYPDELDSDMVGDADILVYGHTHYPVVASVPSGLVINPGSVGQPRDGHGSASFALLDTDTFSVELNRVPYPYQEVQQRIRSSSLPNVFKNELSEGE